MGENIFSKFNSMFGGEEGLAALKKDVEEAGSSTGEFVEVPYGDYEVKISKIELGETGEKSKNPGMPMLKVWFTILTGEFKNQKIFCNQMLTSAFGIHKANELLNSFESGITVQFENFEQYNDMIQQVFREIDGVGEYQLSYTQNNKKYPVYTIVQRFK